MLSFASIWKKFSAPLIFTITFTLFSLATVAANETDPAIQKLNQLIQKKIKFYNQTFPEIQFAHLKNGEWEKSLQALELFIGYQATSLDYEHPPEVREELLFATVEKIRLMLIHKMTSSSLFKAGQMAVASKQHACIITIDPATTALNNRVATQYLIDFSDEILDSIPPENYINNERHLDFILDHEVFHCLDTYHYGGIPMSDKAYSTRYDIYKRENQADMFALAMHIYRNKTLTPCADNMMMMRGMTLLNGELQHNSIEAMKLVIDQDIKTFTNSQPLAIFEKVKQLYNTIAPSYDEYMVYRVAAVDAIKKLGREINEMEKPYRPANAVPDKKLVNKLVLQTENYFQKYTGRKYTVPQN